MGNDAKIVGESEKVLCADMNEKMLQILKKRSVYERIANIETILVNSPADIVESGFDYIFLIDVIHMIGNKAQVIKALMEKLANGGRILIKFEHFQKEQIDNLLSGIKASFKERLYKSYWVIGN